MPSNKKLFFGALCSLFLLWYILGNGGVLTELAHAQGVIAGSGDLDLTQLLKKAGIVLNFSTLLIYILLNFCSALLDTEFIFAINGLTQANNAGGSGLLLNIWQFSRNITNVILAFMLVFVGLYAVIVPTQGGEFIKAHVAKFILAVILVNFSWFFPRVILDVANVLAATVFSLPESIGVECKTQDADGAPADCKYIKGTWFFPETKREGEAENRRLACKNGAESGDANFRMVDGIVCIELGPYDENFNTGLALLHGLYVNHMRIIEAAKVVPEPGPADGTWSGLEQLVQLIVRFMFILFYTLAALFPLIAITVVLMIRIPIIWLTVAFMPFMFVGFVMGDKMGEANTMGIFKHFVKAAFLPAVIAIPLAVGFIMLNAASGATCPADGPYGYLCEDQGWLLSSIRNLWSLLWAFISIIVIWVGVFGAIKKVDPIYAGAATAIQSVGKNWGKFALQMPLALPIFPTGKGNKSIMSMIPPDVIRNPNVLIRSGEFGKKNVLDNFSRDGGSLEANRIATTQKELLQKIADGMKKGSDREITAAMGELSRRMGGSAESMKAVLTSKESAIRAAMDGNGNVGKTNVEIVLRKADELDVQRRGGGAAGGTKVM